MLPFQTSIPTQAVGTISSSGRKVVADTHVPFPAVNPHVCACGHPCSLIGRHDSPECRRPRDGRSSIAAGRPQTVLNLLSLLDWSAL